MTRRALAVGGAAAAALVTAYLLRPVSEQPAPLVDAAAALPLTYAVVGDGRISQTEIQQVVQFTIQPAFEQLRQQGGRTFVALAPKAVEGGTPTRSPCGVVPVGANGCWFGRDEARECLEEHFASIGGQPAVKIVVESLEGPQGCFDGQFIYVNRIPGMMRIVLHELGHQEGGLCDETSRVHGLGGDCPNCSDGAAILGCGGSPELERATDTCVMGASEAVHMLFCEPCRREVTSRARERVAPLDGTSLTLTIDFTRPDRPVVEVSRLAPQVAEVRPFRYAAIVRGADNRVVAFSTSANPPFSARAYEPNGIHALTVADNRAFAQVRIPPTARGPLSVSVVRLLGTLPERVTVETIGEVPSVFEVAPIAVNLL